MRGTDRLSQHEAREFRDRAFRNGDYATHYHQKFLALRKAMREYLPDDIPAEIAKLIGRK